MGFAIETGEQQAVAWAYIQRACYWVRCDDGIYKSCGWWKLDQSL